MESVVELCSQAVGSVDPYFLDSSWAVRWFEQDNEDQESLDSIVVQLRSPGEDMWQLVWLVLEW